jgi:Flp pilus assembly protein TadG
MGPNRRRHRMMASTRHAQAGMTALGFLILATLFGVVGLAALKVTPMYLKNMRMTSIMTDVERELSGQAVTPQSIRNELARRFSVEDIHMDVDALKITQSKNGYSLRVTYEERASYIADVYLLVAFDKQVEILR